MVRPFNVQPSLANFINRHVRSQKASVLQKKRDQDMHLQFFIFIGFIPSLAAGKKAPNSFTNRLNFVCEAFAVRRS